MLGPAEEVLLDQLGRFGVNQFLANRQQLARRRAVGQLLELTS